MVGREGWILTSLLLLKTRPKLLVVVFQDGKEFVARVVGRDHHRGLLLLHIDAKDLPLPLHMTRSEFHVGATTLALGRIVSQAPPTVHQGILSATDRFDGLALQTDASTSPLNYGGALTDLRGRIYGVIVPIDPRRRQDGVALYDSGIGFAIPFGDILDRLPRLRTRPDLYRGTLGVTFDDEPAAPAILRKVLPGSPALRAGFQIGDRIDRIDGVAVTSVLSLRITLARHDAGDSIRLSIAREQTEKTIEVTLDRWTPPPANRLKTTPRKGKKQD